MYLHIDLFESIIINIDNNFTCHKSEAIRKLQKTIPSAENLEIFRFFHRKGDEIQKLSVIQSLPSLLATDTQLCMSRVVPKMQQSLATASTEFHIAASSTFKTILEQKLVSHNVFSQTFLQSILNSLESRDPGKQFKFLIIVYFT